MNEELMKKYSDCSREKIMFDEAKAFLEKHYNDTDFTQMIEEYQELSNKFRGSLLWQSLILDVLDHLERKIKHLKKIGAID